MIERIDSYVSHRAAVVGGTARRFLAGSCVVVLTVIAASTAPGEDARPVLRGGDAEGEPLRLGDAELPVPAGASGISLRSSDIALDLDPARGVLDVWTMDGERRREAASRVVESPAYQTARIYVADIMGCKPSRGEIVRAIANPDSGACGFGLRPAYDRRAEIESLLTNLALDDEWIRQRVTRRVSEFLPGLAVARTLRVSFVIASQSMFDAVTLTGAEYGDSTGLVLVNLSEVLAYGTSHERRRSGLEHVLAHEVFHAAIRGQERALHGWREFPWAPHDPITYIARVMLEEGVAHYIDWKEREGSDSLFTARPGSRERYAFTQLTRACKHLTGAARSPSDRLEILQLAATGPLWSKYGAISGMFAAHRIERARGTEALVKVVESGPSAFLKLYGEVAAADTSLLRLPEQLSSF